MRAITLLILTAVALVAAAPAEGRITCRSGSAVYKDRDVRLFETDYDDSEGNPGTVLRACRTGSRKPRVLYVSATLITTRYEDPERQGNRVLYEVDAFGDEGGTTTIAWYDVRNGTARSTFLDQQSWGPIGRKAVDGAGGVAIVTGSPFSEDDTTDAISYLAPGRRGDLRQPRRLARVPRGSVTKLTVSGGTVRWTLKDGTAGRADI